MAKKSTSKGIIKDVAIVVIAIAVIFVSLQVAFGFGSNPFYVVASGSMIPELQVHDIIVVQGNIPFEDIEIGDIIVFNRPSDHNKVIVHRVVTILDDDPKTLRTKGDNKYWINSGHRFSNYRRRIFRKNSSYNPTGWMGFTIHTTSSKLYFNCNRGWYFDC